MSQLWAFGETGRKKRLPTFARRTLRPRVGDGLPEAVLVEPLRDDEGTDEEHRRALAAERLGLRSVSGNGTVGRSLVTIASMMVSSLTEPR